MNNRNIKHSIDSEFLSLPYVKFSEIALTLSKAGGAQYCDFRFERLKELDISVKDTSLENFRESSSTGYAVRLIINGTWGFASNCDLTEFGVKQTVERALSMAKALSSIKGYEVKLAPENIYKDTYISDYVINPFDINPKDTINKIIEINKKVLDSKKVNFVDFNYDQVLENKYVRTSEGTEVTQQRVRLYPFFNATKVNSDTGEFDSMKTMSVPVGVGYEYMESYDFMKEAVEIPEQLTQKASSQSVEPGAYDLVIDPTNLWLTIHESIGHATELDRSIGFEANYAGTSFATPDKLNNLQYGSKYINIKGDRLQSGGLSTIGYDDDGVKAQEWDIIKDGLLVGYQYNREIAGKMGYPRSNGCSYADSWFHFPVQRMPNVSLMPSDKEISTNDLISKVENGIFIVGDNSWSIDHQRYNFQFTGQRFYKIKNGKLDGQVKDAAYQSNTTEFWNKCDGVGGQSTYLLAGAFNCGKAQPGQVAAVSHGTPSALFRNVKILNTKNEN